MHTDIVGVAFLRQVCMSRIATPSDSTVSGICGFNRRLVLVHELKTSVAVMVSCLRRFPLSIWGCGTALAVLPQGFLAVGTTACSILAGSGVSGLVFVKQSAGHRIC